MIDEIKKVCRKCNQPHYEKYFRKHKRTCKFCESELGKERHKREQYYQKRKANQTLLVK